MSGGPPPTPAGPAPGGGLARMLGAPDAAAVMIANMIGVGILVTPGRVGALLGDQRLALCAWALVGAASLAGALVHAELGCRTL